MSQSNTLAQKVYICFSDANKQVCLALQNSQCRCALSKYRYSRKIKKRKAVGASANDVCTHDGALDALFSYRLFRLAFPL